MAKYRVWAIIESETCVKVEAESKDEAQAKVAGMQGVLRVTEVGEPEEDIAAAPFNPDDPAA